MNEQITILIVDDEQPVRDAMIDLFEFSYPDWRIVTAENGLVGIEIVQQICPDARHGWLPNGAETARNVNNPPHSVDPL